MSGDCRLAWFSPVPPTRSGISAYSAELLPHLERRYAVETFDERVAHDFVWKHRRQPYDLVVYHLGNARCHDYMWAYLAAYPGLVVLHDARLHHARASLLLQSKRHDDYRREFWYDHPDARKNFVEYAVAGLGGPIYYFWPMTRVVVETARLVAVHNDFVARELRDTFAGLEVETIRMGVPDARVDGAAAADVRTRFGISDKAIVFAAFGKATPEKRIVPIERAIGALATIGYDVHLLIVGERDESMTLLSELGASRLAHRVHVTGYVADQDVAAYLAASDVCLCLRWPTALETSASWLRCIAAGRATIVSDLAHTADVPSSVARRVDLVNEDESLLRAMRELASDAAARDAVARAGRDWWTAHHTMDAMAEDYHRVIEQAIGRSAPTVANLPRHFIEDYSAPARDIMQRYSVRFV